LSVLAIGLAILIQIIGRLFGLNLVGLVEVATYAMVAATFLALPYTLKTAGHIRIVILVNVLKGPARRVIEIACYLLALVFVLYFFYYCTDLTIDSFKRGARSQGMLAAHVWIPQALMSCGVLFFALALADGLIKVVRGQMDLTDEQTEIL